MIREPETWFTVVLAILFGLALAATLVFGPGGLLS